MSKSLYGLHTRLCVTRRSVCSMCRSLCGIGTSLRVVCRILFHMLYAGLFVVRIGLVVHSVFYT